MLPAVVAHQIQEELEHFLTTTYAPAGSRFARFFDRFFAGDEFFKGPYVSLGLPLTPQPLPEGLLTIAPPFDPYGHQIAAFRRLTAQPPQSTIVATGTGSGKTESYLYPILDHCAAAVGTPGIKAILIYPMNALANDQAERLAQVIHRDDRLRHKVTAGLFTGDKPGNHKTMGSDYLVTNHEALLAHPPDILLTNYRMLDLLLVRPNRARLWRGTGPASLRFLVVDELHTFDGAQGTDLAVLVRRLKERLAIPAGQLACVGTSATIGGEENAAALRKYAASLFGEPFDEGAIIGEATQSATEFLKDSQAEYVALVPENRSDALDPAAYESLKQYIEAQAELWLSETVADAADSQWRLSLGEKIRRVALFQRILYGVEKGPVTYDDLCAIVARMDGITRADRRVTRYRRLLITSVLSLAGWARTSSSTDGNGQDEKNVSSGSIVPLTRVGVQLWARELRRVVSPVTETPQLRFHDDLTEEERYRHLPVVHCRECGASGWVSFRHDSTPGEIEHGYTEFVSRFFSNSPEIVFLFPPEDEHEKFGQHGELQRICGQCLRLIPPGKTSCSYCGNDDPGELPLVEIDQPVHTGKNGHAHVYHNCPVCQARDSLLLVGSRSTSLLAVAIAQLHASPYTEDRKVLSFSDSVQDAAHHAGFFGARTYSFNLRMALARFLASRPDRATQNLGELIPRLVQYYRGTLRDEAFVSIFLAPRLEAVPEFDSLLSAPLETPGKVTEAMVEAVTTRLTWDLFGELGYLSEIGRTLEKSGVLAVYSDPERVDAAVAELVERFREEIGTLKAVSPSQVGRFVRGILTRVRRRGAIRFPLVERYLESGGNHWLLGRSDEERRVLPWAGRNTRLPAFLADGLVGSGRFDRLSASDRSSHTWNQQWVERALGETEYVDDVLRLTVNLLTVHHLLEREEVKGTPVWAIPAESLSVTRAVRRFACYRHRCNYHTTVAETESTRWLEAPCPRHGCVGTLRAITSDADRDTDGYYASLYTRGHLSRVIPAEHSAIVAPDERERIEALFSHDGDGSKPWHPNLVSSTPTLEMGIDIGDLSATIQTRVPPRPANYLQRIGRSGRKSGSALNLTVATGRPHDLYFFQNPLQMIAADINPPGLFLNAPYVLKRQLLAFAFDQWVAGGIPETAVPGHVGEVIQNAVAGNDVGVFPWNFIHFVEDHAHRVLEAFLERFGEHELDDRSREYLSERLTAVGGPDITRELLERIIEVGEEIASLKERLTSVDGVVAKYASSAHLDRSGEAERDDLERQRKALASIIRSIQKKNTFQFLTDEGLLPNFSFPEAGVVLRSVILRRNKRSTEQSEPLVYEYQRPAAAALGELAPEAEFYGQGRKVSISEIDLRSSELEEWRICDQCHHMEREVQAAEYQRCPRCGSAQWPDTGRKRSLIKMRQVVAVEKDDKSRIYDEREERTPTFFVRNLFVDVDPKEIRESWSMEGGKIPFGFEFVQQVMLRDLNFGRADSQAEPVRLGGLEVKAGGFRICRHCGAVLPSRESTRNGGDDGFGAKSGGSSVHHAAWCPVRDDATAAQTAFSAVFLYRDYQSEAVRFLIPTGMLEIERELESFIAGLFLGLRLHFGGQVDHIRSTHMYVPDTDGGPTRHFLVLYDSIPGGTGYLNQLLSDDTATLRTVFEKALVHMQSCDCDDGCHKCLFSYRQSSAMERISKQTAVSMFQTIGDAWDSLAPIDGSIASTQGNQFVESTLEAGFVHAWSVVPERYGISSRVKPAQVAGKAGWMLTINHHHYRIEPQVHVGAYDQITPASKPDFVIHPLANTPLSRPIAIFTDGYSFHADRFQGILIVDRDAVKRIAIRESERYWAWSLTYDDMKTALEGTEGAYPTGLASREAFHTLGTKYNLQTITKLVEHGAFAALMAVLAYPDEAQWRRVSAFGAVAIAAQGGAGATTGAALLDRIWTTANVAELTDGAGSPVPGDQQQRHFFGALPPSTGAADQWKVAGTSWIESSGALAEELQDPTTFRAVVTLRDDVASADHPQFKQMWNAFWTTVNLLQFLPGVRWGTISAAPVLESRWVTQSEPGIEDLNEVLRYVVDQRAIDLLTNLHAAGVRLPEAGIELTDAHGAVIAEAELGWEDAGVAIILPENQSDSGAFTAAGWSAVVLKGADVVKRIQEVIS